MSTPTTDYTADTAAVRLAELLGLADMAHGGPVTWDDIVAYTAKALGTRSMALTAVHRRTIALTAALGAPDDSTWPELITRVRWQTSVVNAAAELDYAHRPEFLDADDVAALGHVLGEEPT